MRCAFGTHSTVSRCVALLALSPHGETSYIVCFKLSHVSPLAGAIMHPHFFFRRPSLPRAARAVPRRRDGRVLRPRAAQAAPWRSGCNGTRVAVGGSAWWLNCAVDVPGSTGLCKTLAHALARSLLVAACRLVKSPCSTSQPARFLSVSRPIAYGRSSVLARYACTVLTHTCPPLHGARTQLRGDLSSG